MDKSLLSQKGRTPANPGTRRVPQNPTTSRTTQPSKSNSPLKITRARGPEAKEERRKNIVDAASLIFAQLGYVATEMDRVALELGLSKGTLYLYFENKEALFLHCVDQGMRDLNQAIRHAMTGSEDPMEKIVFAFRAYFQFFDEHPQQIELLIQERANFKDRKTQTYFEHRANNRAFWKGIYQSLIESGRIVVSMQLDQFLDFVGTLLYGTMFTQRYDTRVSTINEKTTHLLEFVFRGVLSAEEQKAWKETLKRIE